ncbi:MAG: rhomboid family intramembrane serine protease, partial [Candidatus Dormibacteria bacterium]
VQTLLDPPRSLPSARAISRHAKALQRGAQPPTLAAVDLAERQAMAAGSRPVGGGRVITTPVLTYGLIAAFVVAWILEKVILGRLVPAGYAQSGAADVVGAALNDPHGRGDWWRYVSASFLHDPDSPIHLALNCYATFIIGRTVEQYFGRLVMLSSFLVTGATGVLLWVAATAPGVAPIGLTLGASGGIVGWIGLLLMLGRVQGRGVSTGTAAAIRRWVGSNLLLLVFFGFINHSVNNYAHAGGFIGGVLLGLVVPPLAAIGGRALRRPEQVLLAAVIGVSAVALGIAGMHAAQAFSGGTLQAAMRLLGL